MAPVRITYANYEYVDEVMTLTFAEGPGESGVIMHFMRAMWEDESDSHEVVNGDHDNVDGAVMAWRQSGNELHLRFHDVAAAQLGFDPETRLELDLAASQVGEVHQRLADILVDVPED